MQVRPASVGSYPVRRTLRTLQKGVAVAMSKKRYFDSNFWNDSWVEQLSRDERLFFAYLITNDNTSIAGVYEISMKKMAIEADFEKAEVAAMLKRMEAKVRYIDGWVVLRNGIKSQNYHNDKIRRGIRSILESCPVELLQYINYPNDFDVVIERVEEEPKQQRLLDDLSMSHPPQKKGVKFVEKTMSDDDTSMSHGKYNRIKYKSNTKADTPPGGSNELSKSRKRTYAISMEREREQDARAEQSRTRNGSGLESAKAVAERLRRRKQS